MAEPLSPPATGLLEIPGAAGIWEATAWDAKDHDARYAFVKKACKSKEMQEKAEELEFKYQEGKLPPCVYVERMFVYELPKGGGVGIYSAVPITDDLKAQVTEKGGLKHIVIPTSEHALHHGGWIEAFPEAVIICPGGDEMKPIIEALDGKAKVIDYRTPAKWDKDAIKALSGFGLDVLDTGGFQEILLMHRKSKTLMTCDSIYLSSAKKDDPEGMKNFPHQEWKTLYWNAYMDRSPSFLPIYRTFIGADSQKNAGKVWKKVITWKAERVGSARSGTISKGGVAETKKILEGHWKWCIDA